jgi:hypothetical protein
VPDPLTGVRVVTLAVNLPGPLAAMRPSALRRLRRDRDLPTQLSHIEIVGHDGALEEQPGHDLTYQATCGTLQPPRMPTAPIVDMLATYANHYRRPPRPVPPEGGVLQRKLANEESVSLELFRPALRLARHRNLLGPGGPELTERRTAFVEEVRAVTRRLAVIADIARSKGETR